MVVIRADGNEKIGMGHYMRCFAIAHELRRLGEDVCFLLAPDADVGPVKAQGYSLHQLQNADESLGWDAIEASEWLRRKGLVTVFIDTYRIDYGAMMLLADATHKSYYMDDLYAFDYPVANIINYNLEAEVKSYQGLLTGKHELYLGPAYYPVREEMLQAKVEYLRKDVRRILITTGGTDPFGIESAILKSFVQDSQLVNVEFVVLCGRYYTKDYLDELQRIAAKYRSVILHKWTKSMGVLYASCDICITPGSSSMSEAMTVGIPCISFAFVDNHLNQCQIMAEKEMAPYAGDFRRVPEKVCDNIKKYLMAYMDIDNRNYARLKFAKVFDGKGAARVAKILVLPKCKNNTTNYCHNVGEVRRIIGIRASAILYNFILTNHVQGNVLMPANICECVPAIYKKAGMNFIFCDIEFGTWIPDEREIISLLSTHPDIKILHYNRTYGEMGDHSKFFEEIRVKFPHVIIIDDRCLAMPNWEEKEFHADLTLYSTGKTKPVYVGQGAFAFLGNQWRYKRYHLEGDTESADAAFDASIKRCHAEHKSVEWDILLDNWLDPAQMPKDDYEQRIGVEYANIVPHKAVINAIYKALPNALPEGMHDWRYNLLVKNQDECLQKLFQEGLFASKHYLGLGNGYFSNKNTPNCDWLAHHVINLFNDKKITVEMAKKTVECIRNLNDF